MAVKVLSVMLTR